MDDLDRLLSDALDPTKFRRSKAEECIDSLTTRNGFLCDLTKYVCSNRGCVTQSHRLLALTILKQKITHCGTGECLNVIKSLVELIALEDNRQIAITSAAVVGTGLVLLEPHATRNPELDDFMSSTFNFFFSAFEDSQTVCCINCLRVVSELVESSPGSIIQEAIVKLTPSLLRLTFTYPSTEVTDIAIHVTRNIFLTVLTSGEKSLVGSVKSLWSRFSPSLVDGAVRPCLPLDGSDTAVFHNRTTMGILDFLIGVLSVSKWARGSLTGDTFVNVVKSIEADKDLYFSLQNTMSDANCDVRGVMERRWALLLQLARTKNLHTAFSTFITSNGEHFLSLVIAYSLLCEDEVVECLSDVDLFLCEDVYTGGGVQNTRWTAAKLYRICLPLLGSDALQFLVCLSGSADKTDKEIEGILFLLEAILCRFPPGVDVEACISLECLVRLKDIALHHARVGHPVLAARALLLLRVLLKLFRGRVTDVSQYCPALLTLSVSSLKSSTPLLQMASCKLLQCLLPVAHANDILASFSESQEVLFSIALGDTTSDALLYLSLETYSEWISCCHSVSKCVAAPGSHSRLFQCWMGHIRDPHMGELVVLMFRELITDINDGSFVVYLPWMASVLRGQCGEAEYCVVPYVIQLLKCVFERGSGEAASKVAECLLGDLCTLLLEGAESSIMVPAADCLATLLHRYPHIVTMSIFLAASVESRLAGLDTGVSESAAFACDSVTDMGSRPYRLPTVLLAIACAIVGVDRKEVSLMNAGVILSAIAGNAITFSEGALSRFVIAIVDRLVTVRTDTVAQELISPLAVLLRSHTHVFLRILLSSGLLLNMFSVWLPKMDTFLGKELFSFCDSLLEMLRLFHSIGELDGLTLQWKKDSGGRKVIPLDLALFVAVGKGVLNLLDQGIIGDGSTDEEEWADGCEEDEEEEPSSEDGDRDADQDVQDLSRDISGDFKRLLSEIQPLVVQYGTAAMPFFSSSEISNLSSLLGSAELAEFAQP